MAEVDAGQDREDTGGRRVVSIEFDDKGRPVRSPELSKLLEQEYSKGRRHGSSEADDELKRMKPWILDPKELERLKTVEKEHEAMRLAEAERVKNYEEAGKIREQRFTAERREIEAQRDKAVGTVRRLVGTQIRAAAVEAGARSESLDELERLIGADVDLDGDLNAFVKGEDGKPLQDADGKAVTVEGYVRGYLDKKPHHKAGNPAKGGNAPGGATHRGAPPKPPSSADGLRAAMDAGDADAATQKSFIGNVLLRRGA